MKRICEWAMALLFSGVLLVLMAATILLPKNRYSYYENRNLSAFPEITAESVLSGQVFDDLETLFCDYAAWRTPALKAVTWADLNVFRRPVVNETVVTDDVLLPQLYDPAMSDDDIRAQAKLVAEDNAALQKQVESYGGHYCYVAVPTWAPSSTRSAIRPSSARGWTTTTVFLARMRPTVPPCRR